MICPNCGREFYTCDTLDTEWYLGKYYDYVIGTCPDCGHTYKWTEKYIFDSIEDVEEINAEETLR